MQTWNTLLAVGNGDFSMGAAIAITGLLIVFVALILISLFIATLPRMLKSMAKIWPEIEEPHAGESHPESLVADETPVLAAIGFVLHTELQRLAEQQESSTST